MNLDLLWYRDKPGTRMVKTRNVKENGEEEPGEDRITSKEPGKESDSFLTF